MKKLVPDIKYEDLPEKEIEDGYLYLMKTPTKLSVKHYKSMTIFPEKIAYNGRPFKKFGSIIKNS